MSKSVLIGLTSLQLKLITIIRIYSLEMSGAPIGCHGEP